MSQCLTLILPSREAALLVFLVAQVPLMFFLGPTQALVQDLVSPSMRATVPAVFILVLMMVGAVLGTQMVGLVSDALRPMAGSSGEALRLSMSLATLVAFWAAAHFWFAGRALREESKP